MISPFTTLNGRRFIFACAGLFVLYWLTILISLPIASDAPAIRAALRFTFGGDASNPNKLYWRYTGERPGEGEVLRVTYRQATTSPNDSIQVVALLGDEAKPVLADEHFKGNVTPSKNYFDWHYVEIPDWPADRELWVGYESKPGARIWFEYGDPGFGNLQVDDTSAYSRKRDGLIVSREQMFSSLYAEVVYEGSTPPSVRTPWIILTIFSIISIVPVFLLKSHRRWWLMYAVLYMVFLWKAMEVLFPSQWLWGGYYHYRFGRGWFWIGLLLVQLVTFPALKAVIGVLWSRAKMRRVRWYPRGGVAFLAVWSAAIVIMCVMVSQFWVKPIYGDGYGSLNLPGYDYHNPFATAIFHMSRDVRDFAYGDGLKNLITNGKTWAAQYSDSIAAGIETAGAKVRGIFDQPRDFDYADIGFIQTFTSFWAPFFLIFSGLIAFSLGRNPRERILFLLLILFAKYMIVLFGYVEIYGPALAVQTCLIWLILRAYRRGGVLLPTAFSFFAYLFQMTGAMAIPAIAVLWIKEFSRSETKFRWFASRVSATAVLAILIWLNCLAILYVFKHDFDMTSFKNHVPALKTEVGDFHGLPMLYGSTGVPSEVVFLQYDQPNIYHSYTWNSWHHFSQISCEWVFLLGPVLPWFIILIFTARRRTLLSFERWGFTFATLAFLISSFFLATSFPYPKDWDVFTIQSLWVLVTVLWYISNASPLKSQVARWALIALLSYFIWDTGIWWLYNITWGPEESWRGFVYF